MALRSDQLPVAGQERRGSEPENPARSTEVDQLWTVVEAAKFLNLSPLSLYHMIGKHGRGIPVIRISSRCIRFSRRALMEWVQSRTEPADEDDRRHQSKTTRQVGPKL